jgi:hypothetical protein
MIVGVEPQARVIEVVPEIKRRSPRRNPPAFWSKPVVKLLIGLADIDPVDEARNGHESRSNVGVFTVVSKMQALPLEFQLFRRSSVVIAVSLVS